MLVVALVALIGSLTSKPSPARHPATAASAATHVTATATTPAFSAADQAFLTDMGLWMAAHGLVSSATAAEQVKTGEAICTALRTGVSATTIIDGVTPRSTGRVIVRTAEKDICPDAVPHVIATFSGTGSENTPQFNVPDTWTLNWHYDCSAIGTSNFIVNEDGGSDVNGVTVNKLGAVQSGSTVAYSDAGTHYLQVIAGGCSWRL